jgi:glycosyltransferase involved in cell wall biosynthesis
VSTSITYAGTQLHRPPEPADLRDPVAARGDPTAAREPGSKPHVCFVAPTTWPLLSRSSDIRVVGGAEVQQCFIARALAGRGYRVSMVCYDYGQREATVIDGVTVYKAHRPDEGMPVVRFVHPRITRMWQALKRVNADVYYQRTSDVLTTVVALFCRYHGKRSIYAGASDMDFLPGQEEIRLGRDRWIFQQGLKRVDSIIVQNPVQQENCRLHYGREPTLIPSCYLPPADARNDRGGYVLWIARMGAPKRPQLAIEIARRLPDLPFVVVGGPEPSREGEEFFRSLMQAAASVPNLRMAGFVPWSEADGFFNQARVVLNTSRWEGFPNSFLQAWARGIPTVSFIDTGSREDGMPVTSVASGVDDAAARVARLMGDDLAWHQASQRCLRHFRRNHSVDSMLVRYEHLLATLGRTPR